MESNKNIYELVESLRSQSNGIVSIRLLYGDDGKNICRFSSLVGDICRGESTSSMEHAVVQCCINWMKLTCNIYDMCTRATLGFCGSEFGLFNTQHIAGQVPGMPMYAIEQLLENADFVVKLQHNNRWYLLPYGSNREMKEKSGE